MLNCSKISDLAVEFGIKEDIPLENNGSTDLKVQTQAYSLRVSRRERFLQNEDIECLRLPLASLRC